MSETYCTTCGTARDAGAETCRTCGTRFAQPDEVEFLIAPEPGTASSPQSSKLPTLPLTMVTPLAHTNSLFRRKNSSRAQDNLRQSGSPGSSRPAPVKA